MIEVYTMNRPRGLRRSIGNLLGTALLTGACANSGVAPTAGEWRLSESPIVRIGVVEGEAAYQFDRIAGVLRLGDGRIVVADAGTQELRFYDPSGRHLATTGGSGAGPGEFRGLASLALLPGDSLLGLDQGNSRISIHDAQGAFVRSWFLESPGRGLYPSRIFGLTDGSVLISYLRGHMPGDPGGVIRNPAPLLRYSATGEPLDEVAEVPGEEWFYSPELQVMTFRPFGRTGHIAVTGSTIYLGGADSYEIEVYDVGGRLQRSLTQPRTPVAVTAEDIRRYKDARLQEISDPAYRPQQERINAALPFPETMPAYASFLADAVGYLWVEEYRYPADDDPARWSIFDARGHLVATIETPRGFRPHFINDDLVLGVSRDGLDVEYVEVYELVGQGR